MAHRSGLSNQLFFTNSATTYSYLVKRAMEPLRTRIMSLNFQWWRVEFLENYCRRFLIGRYSVLNDFFLNFSTRGELKIREYKHKWLSLLRTQNSNCRVLRVFNIFFIILGRKRAQTIGAYIGPKIRIERWSQVHFIFRISRQGGGGREGAQTKHKRMPILDPKFELGCTPFQVLFFL